MLLFILHLVGVDIFCNWIYVYGFGFCASATRKCTTAEATSYCYFDKNKLKLVYKLCLYMSGHFLRFSFSHGLVI